MFSRASLGTRSSTTQNPRAIEQRVERFQSERPRFESRSEEGLRMLADGSILDSLLPPGPNDTPCSFNFPSHVATLVSRWSSWHVHLHLMDIDPEPYDLNVTPHSPCPKLAHVKGRLFIAPPGPTIPDDVQSGFPAIVVEKNGECMGVGRVRTRLARAPYPRSGPGACDVPSSPTSVSKDREPTSGTPSTLR